MCLSEFIALPPPTRMSILLKRTGGLNGRSAPPAKIDDPVHLPRLSTVGRPGALPVCGVRPDGRPSEARSDWIAVCVSPVAEEVDLPVAKGAFPHVEVAGLEGVGP